MHAAWKNMLIAVVGKPNSGKTTFFSAATLVDAEISSRIFTTIKPNKGVSCVRTKCVCKELGTSCNPKDGKCIDGSRYIPVKLIDIAGLVPDAHKGRGLGNQFLSDIMEADALIHVVDASGSTDSNGNLVAMGTHDPREDVAFLEEEIDYWMLGILKRNIKAAKPIGFENYAIKQLSGLKIGEEIINSACKEMKLNADSSDGALLNFIARIRMQSKPMITAANKIDLPSAAANKGIGIPTSAESELALRKAAEHGAIKYNPGDSDFVAVGNLNDKQRNALDYIRENVLFRYGTTGVQECIDATVFGALQMIVVYPVENEHKFSDKKGNILPDALLIKKGSIPRDLAYRVHKDIGDRFIAAVDARTGKRVAADYELHNGDIISIKIGH